MKFLKRGIPMKSIGSAFLFFGIGTIVLNLIGYEFVLLSWIDNWGEAIGWVIRGAMIAVGGGLYFLGGTNEGGKGEELQPEVNKPAESETVKAE